MRKVVQLGSIFLASLGAMIFLWALTLGGSDSLRATRTQQLKAAKILFGQGRVRPRQIQIAQLERHHALIQFDTAPFSAKSYHYFSVQLNSYTKLLDIRLFWRRAKNPNVLHTSTLYPGRYRSFAYLSSSQGWEGKIIELGVDIVSNDVLRDSLDSPVTLRSAKLSSASLLTNIKAGLESWIRFWGWDSRTINSAVPRTPALLPKAPILLGALVLSVGILLFVGRPIGYSVVRLCLLAWVVVSLTWVGGLGIDVFQGHTPDKLMIFDKSLVKFLDQARLHLPSCSPSVRIIINSENIYLERRASYLLKPCNAAPGRNLFEALSDGTFILILRPSAATFDSGSGLLAGIGYPARVKEVLRGPIGSLYRVAEQR